MQKENLPIVSSCSSRREFISGMTAAAGLALLGSGCSFIWTNHEVVFDLPGQNGKIIVSKQDYPVLSQPGGYLPIQEASLGLRLLLIHTLAGEFVAFNMSCTHRGADVELNADKTGLVCKLHKSEFDMNGQVVDGPARHGLERYPVEPNGDVLSVILGQVTA